MADNTGFKTFQNLELYYLDNNTYAGSTKINVITDPDYKLPVYDTVNCPLTTRYYNTVRTLTAVKSGCVSPEMGSTVTLTAVESQFSSTISVSDANTLADNWLSANILSYTDDNGVCRIYYFVYKNCSTGTYVYQNDLVPGVSVGQTLVTDDGYYRVVCEQMDEGEFCYTDYNDWVPYLECWEFIGQFETDPSYSYRSLTDTFTNTIYVNCTTCLSNI